jgi:hypothetical protein
MPAHSAKTRGLHSADPAADNRDFLFYLRRNKRKLLFAHRNGINRTGTHAPETSGNPFEMAYREAAVMTADAGPDIFNPPFSDLVAPLGVGKQSPRNADAVDHSAFYRLKRYIGIVHFAGADDGNLYKPLDI